MTRETYIAELELIEENLKKAIASINTKLERLSTKRELSKKSLTIKGYEVRSEEDLRELVEGDVITSDAYIKYLQKLKSIQKEESFNQAQEAAEKARDYFLHELNNVSMNLEEEYGKYKGE